MHILYNSVLALGAISLLALAGHAETSIENPRSPLTRRQAPAGFVVVPPAQLQILQSDYNSFKDWMKNYIPTVGLTNPQAAKLSQYAQAYDISINTFLGRYANSSTLVGALMPIASVSSPVATSTAEFVSS